jgi:hypothetical protein
MRLDFFVGIASHEYVRVGIQAVGPALGATALEVGDLLDAYIEFRLPLVLWDIDIFAVEDLIDRVGTVGRVSARCASGVMMSHSESQCGERTKSCESKKTHLQAVPSLRSSSSSDGCLLGLRLVARDCAGEGAAEEAAEATRERALRDTVLWLSSACLRRSRMVGGFLQIRGSGGLVESLGGPW